VVTYKKELNMKSLLLKLYTNFPVVALVVGIAYVFFASDVYRYPCQDPANWGIEECNPPICNATGTCTKDLVANGDDIVTQLDKMKAINESLGIKPNDTPSGE
jgi:hypothetical protein